VPHFAGQVLVLFPTEPGAQLFLAREGIVGSYRLHLKGDGDLGECIFAWISIRGTGKSRLDRGLSRQRLSSIRSWQTVMWNFF